MTRECKEDVTIDGYLIKKKTRVMVNAWAIGRDPKVWDRAEIFDPTSVSSSNASPSAHIHTDDHCKDKTDVQIQDNTKKNTGWYPSDRLVESFKTIRLILRSSTGLNLRRSVLIFVSDRERSVFMRFDR
ncbi:hypothetical protein LR48_Vigan10g019300 [Vigna angularis]|uniref:Cytochrome P450 n=1 Tax=Phaseolus angularis TaxID=3914 RepID=A0A0L9VGX8_PHAAN|nr:hypothetical protein LR48_Vigan10g019300 [Vigna angularis]